ncbi:hypothetical protein O181_058056 [Austropuccinia psidii MF-1]|uniref:Integrase catalytic domain-containing protein n=1 Tax=Austropuccinia psidii MF-1 TaxID=1389203 RepID=A0A9Q3E9H5_9BASI|nr:hypothetical protein [Austropuccinia psidii MF-1]
MNWVTALPPGGDKCYNACIVIVDRYSKTLISLPCHKDDTAMDTALLICNRVISHTGLFKNIISDRQNLHQPHRLIYIIFWVQNYHFQQHTIHKQMALELAYKTSIHASTGKTLAMLENVWNPKLPVDTLNKDLFNIHPTASSFKLLLDKKWDKSHETPQLQVGDVILVSTLNFDNINGHKELKDSFAGPFIIKDLLGTNAVHVQLSGELENKHSTFPVNLVKHYTSSDKELFPLRNETTSEVPPLDQSQQKKVLKVLKERRLRGKNEREYLVRYRNPQHEDEWIAESKIPYSHMFLTRFFERTPIPQ